MKVNLKRRWTAVVISLCMLLSLFAVDRTASAATLEIIAAWDYTAAPSAATIPANSGELATKAELTNYKNAAPTYSATSLSISGWDNGAGTKYWQLSLSTKGYDNLTLSAKTRSSGTGPRDFKVIYSIDNGTNWTDVLGSVYAITGTTLSNYMPAVNLPADAYDSEKLLLRFVMTSNASSGNTANLAASGGTSNINNILIAGTPVSNSETVAGIEASPTNGSVVALGSKVTLTCGTEGAAIMYSVNGSEFKIYDSAAQVTLNELPATMKAYGTKGGLTNSVSSTFNYTQGRTAAVSASPNGGSVVLNKLVTLTCDTPNAVIKYSLDAGASWNDYTTPIKLSSLPATIKTYATAEGLMDSSTTTLNFTQKENTNYNIYFGQLHSHTNYSDGLGTVDEAYTYARDNAKVDFIAVTDHSNSLDNASTSTITEGSKSTEWVGGHAAADKYTSESFVGIYGYEMTWSNGTGHMNTFNTQGFENRETAKYKNADGLKQYYDVLKQVPDSISQFNHPGSTFGDFNDFAYYDPQIDKQITLIEVGNGEGAIGSSGYFASYEYYTRALDKGWHLSPTNNQDNHLGKWGNANTAKTVVLADSLTRENIYDAMRNMRTYATEDKNLRIKYTLNGEIMGTVFDSKPESVNIRVELEDPDNEALGKVSVISNGGKVVASKVISSSKDTVEFNFPSEYSYYYIRVDESDKDIAVTAPVWIGEVEKAGISKTVSSTSLPIKGESLKITSSLFNNETAPMNIMSLVYSINGSIINSAQALEAVKSLGTGTYSFDYIPHQGGKFNIDVKLTAMINGVEKIFTDVLKLDVVEPAVTTKVVVDATHFNDYVAGYYANNLGNFTTIANNQKVAVIVEKNKLTDTILKDAQLLIITAPAKKAGTANGISYQPQSFSDEDITVIKNFVNNGGNLLVCGIADYQDGTGVYQTTTQMNKLLEGIGASSRFNNDEVIDNIQKLNNQNFRLAFDDYNMDSQYLQEVLPGQTYSFYSGCSVSLDSTALAEGKTTWLVKGHDTTESIDSNKNLVGIALPKGSIYALAVEQLNGGGKMFIGGTVYISDFEVKAQLDNSSQLQNSNYNIVMNILESVKKVIPITPVKEVRSAQKGEVYCVEGTVTAGKAPTDNSFFDTLYIQDATGGINLFPVSGADIRVGQKVKAVGTVDEYQGDLELRVIEYSVTDSYINPINPTLVSTKDAMDSKNGGSLLNVEGKVINMDNQNIYIDDGSGAARVFLDGYIGDGSGDQTKAGKWDPMIQIGDRVNAVGLASVDPIGARLRVRNTNEIVRIKDTIPPVITITGVEDKGLYNTDVLPIVTVNEGILTMTLNGKHYNGEKITEVGAYILKISAIDRDGNISLQELSFAIDKTAPVITVNGIKDGGIFKLNQKVIINWVSTDEESGVDTSYGDIESGKTLDTSKVGKNVVNFKAKDKAGNVTEKSITYYVQYDYSGVLKPINNNGSNVFKAGSTIPVKFQLKDSNGVYVSNAVAKAYIDTTSNGVRRTINTPEDNAFRYDSSSKQYILNLKTKDCSPGLYNLRIDLGDGSTNIVIFTLK